jgi:hypothetical protein
MHQPIDKDDASVGSRQTDLPSLEGKSLHAAERPPSWTDRLTRAGEEGLAWLKALTSAAVYATLIVTFVFQIARVEGQSMVPTLDNQDRLVVNKLAYRLSDPQVGDIVMLEYPLNPDQSYVKRIVAGPAIVTTSSTWLEWHAKAG